MAKFTARIAPALALVCCLATRLFAAGEAAGNEYRLGDAVPLNESDLQAITVQVMQKDPLVASSPGVKFARAQRCCTSDGQSRDVATIIYLPHVESAGVKQAFQARCERQAPNELWTCGEVEIRRYLKLDSQDFEVRLLGNIEVEAALALIQATREAVQMSAPRTSAILDTAIIILPEGAGYLVEWGSADGNHGLTVMAHLREEGKPTDPDDWESSVVEEHHQ